MTCTTNPKLFKEFKNGAGEKITPSFANDWEIIPAEFSYEKNSHKIVLHSKKLNQKIFDINVHDVLNFLKKRKLTTIGLTIEGEWIIGQDRKFYSREEYYQWMQKYGKMVDSKFSLRDLKPRKLYKFKCGAEGYYLGKFKVKGKWQRLFGFKTDNAYTYKIVKNGNILSYELDDELSLDELKFALEYYVTTNADENNEYNKDRDFDKVIKEELIIGKKEVYNKEYGIIDKRYFDYKEGEYCDLKVLHGNKKRADSYWIKEGFKHKYKAYDIALKYKDNKIFVYLKDKLFPDNIEDCENFPIDMNFYRFEIDITKVNF